MRSSWATSDGAPAAHLCRPGRFPPFGAAEFLRWFDLVVLDRPALRRHGRCQQRQGAQSLGWSGIGHKNGVFSCNGTRFCGDFCSFTSELAPGSCLTSDFPSPAGFFPKPTTALPGQRLRSSNFWSQLPSSRFSLRYCFPPCNRRVRLLAVWNAGTTSGKSAWRCTTITTVQIAFRRDTFRLCRATARTWGRDGAGPLNCSTTSSR